MDDRRSERTRPPDGTAVRARIRRVHRRRNHDV